MVAHARVQNGGDGLVDKGRRQRSSFLLATNRNRIKIGRERDRGNEAPLQLTQMAGGGGPFGLGWTGLLLSRATAAAAGLLKWGQGA